MPNQETNVKTLKINRLTDAQYDAAIKNDAELYLTPDDNNSLSRNIGETVFSLIPLTDASLHLTDGALIDGNGIYSAFYNYMLNLYGDGTNPPNYFTDETSWQNSVTTYGVCGKFVINTTNQTIRLPKITGIVEGTLDVNSLGDLVEAGLPNITGTATFAGIGSSSPGIGAFTSQTNGTAIAGVSAGTYNKPYFDASQSNSIYSDSVDTVQPQTIKGYYYIVLATTVKTNIQVDIDEIATDLNNKADKDLSNTTIPHITETYSSGTDWYRVYSDGWCEQGAIIQGTSGTWNFLKPFINTNYIAQISMVWSGTSAGWDVHTIASKSSTYLTFNVADNSPNQLYACGYIS